MHSDTAPTPPGSGQQDIELVAVVCRLPPAEHHRFTVAAERHGAGSTAGQMRVLIRAWMRELRDADLPDIAA